MENTLKRVLSLTLLGLSMILLVGCGAGTNQTKNKTITNAKDLPSHLAKGENKMTASGLSGYNNTQFDDLTRADVEAETDHDQHNKVRYVVFNNTFEAGRDFVADEANQEEFKSEPQKLADIYREHYFIYKQAKMLLDENDKKDALLNKYEKFLIKTANKYYKLEK